MKNHIKDFLYFTKGERRGVAVLLILVGVLTAARIAVAQNLAKRPTAASAVKTQSKTSFKRYEAPVLHIELNTADTLLLTELRGIGPGYARRIVGFRQRLGGFYCKEQLLDVYGFTDEMFANVEQDVWVDASKITPLRVNQLGIAQLKRHPYIGYYQAVALVAARDSAGGRLSGMHDIPLSRDLTPDDLERLRHYLSFE
ncbi:MAG: helix-hairpin-helix domain-containing protein [Paludibacteraceae bacterium]|nr:helix-hairpin-helix domain-containing protein [Paludibacteraceae bacterium]